MGCDIHCYVEFLPPLAPDVQPEENPVWYPFGGRINPGRDYTLFSLLAGVRNYDDEVKPLLPERGLPPGLAYESRMDNQLYIVPDDRGEGDDGGSCTMKDAEYFVKVCGSQWLLDEEGKKYAVTHPDWHSRSWCTSTELKRVLTEVEKTGERCDDRYWAVFAAMRMLEEKGNKVRLVFWFDN